MKTCNKNNNKNDTTFATLTPVTNRAKIAQTSTPEPTVRVLNEMGYTTSPLAFDGFDKGRRKARPVVRISTANARTESRGAKNHREGRQKSHFTSSRCLDDERLQKNSHLKLSKLVKMDGSLIRAQTKKQISFQKMNMTTKWSPSLCVMLIASSILQWRRSSKTKALTSIFRYCDYENCGIH